MKQRSSLALAVCLMTVAAASCTRLRDGEYTLTVLTTNDVHGHFFDSTYVGGGLSKSLMAVQHIVDSVRVADGADHVVFVDAGDCLQGDNAAYYFNYVDTASEHVYSRMVGYMGYDAVAVGNHDVETGHAVYDRVVREMARHGVPFLAGNALRNDDGKPYFPACTIVRRGGLKVAILGYTNANIRAWLAETVWSGMHFVSIVPLVQEQVDAVRKREHPDVVIAVMHSGVGKGDGTILENEALDVFRSVRGVDFVVCGHDHRPYTEQNDTMALINSGSHCRYVGYGTLRLGVSGGRFVDKAVSADLIPVTAARVDTVMSARFHDDYTAVKAFTLQEVGTLVTDLRTRDAYRGMSDYINLVHTLQISCAPAQVSIAAPLTYNGLVRAGTLVYNDLFTIYPFENQLYVLRMTGREIRDYLEYSYDGWIQTLVPGGHVLKIVPYDDPRTGAVGWSFVGRSYNFDSAAGLVYTVDVTQPFGSRVCITSLSSGEPFDPDAWYNVAMTSYRASGGGNLLRLGAGIDPDEVDGRIVERYPEIRNLLYQYLVDNGTIDPAVTGDPERIGSWRFVPECLAGPALDRDLALLFR